MPLSHAVAWIEHLGAHVIQFDANHSVDQRVKQHVRYTRQHGSHVREQREFFEEICEALAGIQAVLVVGHAEPESAFRQYVSKHRPALALHVVGWEIVDHPTEAEVLKLAREFFVRQGEMAATPRMR
jgi:alanine dehydrogenase